MPKLLLDLVEQVEGGKASQRQAAGENSVESNGEVDRKEDDLQEEDIAHNLPKVSAYDCLRSFRAVSKHRINFTSEQSGEAKVNVSSESLTHRDLDVIEIIAKLYRRCGGFY